MRAGLSPQPHIGVAWFTEVGIGGNRNLQIAKEDEKVSAPRMAEFESRRALGIGQFMTAAEIDKLNVVATNDLLHRLTPNRTRPARRLGPGAVCTRQTWYLDGVLLPASTNPDELPSPKDLAGIEFYASPATIPLQYKSTSGGGFCGVVLMWTKDGY